MKTVIGLIGEQGAGKETFAKLLAKKIAALKVSHTTFSAVIVETLKTWGIPPTRPNCQALAQVMNKTYGDGTLTRAVLHRALGDPADIVIIDGVRWQSDFDGIRRLDQDESGVVTIMVYVTASPEARYERIKKRSQRPGEADLTWEQFLLENAALNETLIPHLGSMADFRVNNDGTPEGLEARVDEFIALLS